ncbi:MAG: ABC transporter permease [Bacteroidota bacterium]
MIINYIKIAYRSLLKNKGYSFLNIFGLAIGIACASLIFLWVEDELSFDTSFANQEHIYYVATNQNYEGIWRTIFATPGPLAKDLREEIPGVKRATRSSSQEQLFSVGDNNINLRGRYVDEDFLDIFSLEFIEGSREKAFSNPNSIILTQESAEKLFGTMKSGLGKTIKISNDNSYLVTGIIKNLPKNVTFTFNWVAPFERYGEGQNWMLEYGNNFSDTFVELEPEANFETVDKLVREIIHLKDENLDTYAFLHAMKDWHLHSKFENGKMVGGRITYVRTFTVIALIILLIACINFMNLSTARSQKRANEVGVRKALGSSRGSLIAQFISEALIISFIATTISVLLLMILLPQFNLIIEKDLSLGLSQPSHVITLVSIAVGCGLLAGLYPAFYLSSFRPVAVLKGLKVTEGSISLVRKGLVVGQFTISIVFIVVTILVYQQIQFAKNRDLGYDLNQLLSIPINDNVVKKFDVLKEELIKTGAVKNVALTNAKLLQGGFNGSNLQWEGGTNTEDVLVSFRYVSESFFNTTGMEIIEGRGFSNNIDADSTHTIVSQSLAKMMRSGEESVLGKTITRGDYTVEVIGVVKDYLYGNMFSSSDPVMFYNYPNIARHLYIKTEKGVAVDKAISKIGTVFKSNLPDQPFEYTFTDDAFNQKFKSEQLVGSLSQIFAILAIFISCLGLFGLAAYTAEQRKKEVGIRKVLGASVSVVVRLLSKDFLKLVVIAIIVATPIAWYFMHNWLLDYEYRIEINWWVFVAAGFAAIGIAMVTVSFQAVKAAIANPTESLKMD